MAYADIVPPEVLSNRPPTGAVVPMKTALGNDFPQHLRAQQVTLSVLAAVGERIDAALAGGAIKLATVHLGAAGKALLKRHLLERIAPEVYGDPIPAKVRAAKKIVSPKALTLINDRLEAAFAGERLELPGVTLTRADQFDLITLLAAELLNDDEFDPAERLAARAGRDAADRVARVAPPAVVRAEADADGEPTGDAWEELFG